MDQKRSPLRQKPLNAPGDSLRQRLDDLLWDKAMPWLFITGFCYMLAGLEWCRYLLKFKPMPVFSTVFALGVTAYAAFKIRGMHGLVGQIRQGIDGEKTVGQFLDGLKARGYQVIHDVCEDGYNIDHVLIGPTGVFAIETKTISKPIGRDAKVIYDGRQVLVDGYLPD